MSEQNIYKALLTSKRFRSSETGYREIILESESDRSRLVFSAPFRRLQQKAQVFSLESNAAVRSRLTHSLEVAQVGRFLAEQIAIWLKEVQFANDDECRAYVNFVETACLMHDLGNPPFGHFGEAAIQEWFSQHGRASLIAAIAPDDPEDSLINNALGDFLEFDGNCQGLRIATKLQWNRDEYGLNLTHTALASFLKYLRSPSNSDEITKAKLFHKKPGFFDTEANLVKEIWNTFNYGINPQRFPLAYVMEAADDIAYCISDLEDSLEKELINKRFIFSDIATIWLDTKVENRETCDISNLIEYAKENIGDELKFTFTDFRTRLSRLLTNHAVKQYQDHHNEILCGNSKPLLSEDTNAGKILEVLKGYCRKNVYSHYSVQQIELSGYAAIRGLLDHFGILLKCSEERFNKALNATSNKDANGKAIVIENKLLSLFPPKHIKVYKHECDELKKSASNPTEYKFGEWNLRAHLITDFISGMTDDFAMQTFQNLSGIKTQL
jgi:dGTPase